LPKLIKKVFHAKTPRRQDAEKERRKEGKKERRKEGKKNKRKKFLWVDYN